MKKRLIIAAVAVLIAVLAAYLYSTRQTEDGSIRASGIVEGIEVNLSSKVAGRIRSICCSVGDEVKEGQTAVELDSDDIAASVAQARAGIERARADIASAEAALQSAGAQAGTAEADIAAAEADLVRAQSQEDLLKRERDRAHDLFTKGYISRESYDQAVTSHDTAAASSRAAQARLDASRTRRQASLSQVAAAKGQMGAARARLKEADANLGFNESKFRDTMIVAPISGTVVFRALEKGEYATPGTTIMTVVDPASLHVRVDLEESLVAGIPRDAAVTITADGLRGRKLAGRIVEIGRYGEFATQRDVTRGRQDIKTFRVKVRPEDPERLLKPGMTASVEITRSR